MSVVEKASIADRKGFSVDVGMSQALPDSGFARPWPWPRAALMIIVASASLWAFAALLYWFLIN